MIAVDLRDEDKVDLSHFDMISVLGTGGKSSYLRIQPVQMVMGVWKCSNNKSKFVGNVSAYGTVYLVKKRSGVDEGCLYAMKVLKKTNIVQKVKTAEHTKTERQVIYCHAKHLVHRIGQRQSSIER